MKKKCGNGEEEKRRNEVKRLRGEKCLKEKVKKGKSESFFFFIEGDLVVINFTFRMKK